MRVTAIGLGALALTLFQPASSMAGVTGNLITRICESSQEEVQSLCVLYFRGLIDGMEIGRIAVARDLEQDTEFLRSFCPAEEVEHQQFIDVVLKYLEDNPEIRHKDVGPYAFVAWHRAFPCN